MSLTLKRYPKRSPNWQIRGTVAGHYISESTGTTERDKAEKYRLKREREIYDFIALGEQPPCTFADAVIVYVNKGGETKYLTKLLDYFKEKPLREIGQAEIDMAAIELYPNAKASTINRQCISVYISVVKAALKAELAGAVLRPIERRKEAKPIVTPASDEHIQALLPHCSKGLAALVNLMTYTGLRTGEALRVKEDDCKDGYISIGKTKNGEPRNIPIPDSWVYPDGGFGFSTTQGVGRALRAAHKRAEVPYRDGHELGRHAFAARWLREGYSIKGLKDAGGWKKLAVVDQSYGHLEQTEIHDKMRALSKINRAKSVQS
jgi:integrase